MNEKSEVKLDNKSATKIQSLFKGYITRKTYKIKHLDKKDQTNYNVLIKGNDPINIIGLPTHKKEEKIALIGTSGMRSIEIACQLSQGTPKIIILDNSFYVTDFWRNARDIVKKAQSKSEFVTNLFYYVRISNCNRNFLSDKESNYLENLIDTYGFDKVKKIISHATIIGQSWADKNTLIKIKNILNHNEITKIYAYPSNIVAYINACNELGFNCKKNAEQVLKNIEVLNPEIAIHTDLVDEKSKNLFLITNHSPSLVKMQLGLEKSSIMNEENINSSILDDIINKYGIFGLYIYKKIINQINEDSFKNNEENNNSSENKSLNNFNNC